MPTALRVKAMVMPTSVPLAAPSAHICVSLGQTFAAALGAAQAATTAAPQIPLTAALIAASPPLVPFSWYMCQNARCRSTAPVPYVATKMVDMRLP